MKRVLLASLLLTGCGARTNLDLPGDEQLDAASAEVEPAPVDAAESLTACFGEIGPTEAVVFRRVRYSWEEFPSGDGKGMRGVVFDGSCQLQGSGSSRVVSIPLDECDVLRRWATSKRLLDALLPDSPEARACVARGDDRHEETRIEGSARRELSTRFCAVEPFVTHGRCMRRLARRYLTF